MRREVPLSLFFLGQTDAFGAATYAANWNTNLSWNFGTHLPLAFFLTSCVLKSTRVNPLA